jgi:hypothetical protein
VRRKQRSNVRVMTSLTHEEYGYLLEIIDFIAEFGASDIPANQSEAIRQSIMHYRDSVCRDHTPTNTTRKSGGT